MIQGQVRRLLYQKHSNSLYFTTTLQHVVQSYSLGQNILLEPTHAHPSSPTLFALSPSSHLLLSASAHPPVIQLSNRSREPSISLRPNASSASVVAAAFHPDTPNTFLLAFSDGTLAAYDASHMFRSHGTSRGGEIGHVKKLHTITSTSSQSDFGAGDGITATTFVPGTVCTAASVGADGRCCIVDFGYDDLGNSKVLESWHVRGAATSVSILPHKRYQDIKITVSDFLVAIGRQDGMVRLYDLEGELKWQRNFDLADGSRIIDVEWLEGSGILDKRSSMISLGPSRISALEIQQRSSVPNHPRGQSRRSYPYRFEGRGSNQFGGEQVPSRSQSLRPDLKNYSNSSARPLLATDSNTHELEAETPIDDAVDNSRFTESNTANIPPNVPPRPAGREGGQYSIRKAELTSIKSVATGDLRVLEITNPPYKSIQATFRSEGNDNESMTRTITKPTIDKSQPGEHNSNITSYSPWNNAFTGLKTPGTKPTDFMPSTEPSPTSSQTPRFNSNLDPSSADSDTIIDWTTSSNYTPHPIIRQQSRPKIATKPKSSNLLVKASKIALKRMPTKLATATITQRLLTESQSAIVSDGTGMDWQDGYQSQGSDVPMQRVRSLRPVSSMPLPLLYGHQESSENRILNRISTLHNRLRAEMEEFKRETREDAKAQKNWFIEEVRGLEEGKRKLEGENGELRDELARLERGRGRVG